MKKYFRALMMSFTMFCAIPCPFHKWDEESRPLMTVFLPVVGAFIGALWTLTAYLLRLSELPPMICGAILCAFPFFITGGMHFDGFMDVTDAVRSWRDIEEKRRILKDPHVGSFAVIAAILIVVAQFAALSSVKSDANIFTLLLVPVVSRCVAALCVSLLRPISVSEYSGVYQKGIKKSHIAVLIVMLALSVALGFTFLGSYGFASLAVIGGYLLYLFRAFRSLGGMSGDISGYALTFGEFCGIVVYALV